MLSKPPASDASSTILIIDDDPMSAKLLTRYLASIGYLVFYTPNGEEGLHQLHEVAPDLILVDAIMPGMTGFEFCKHVRDDAQTTHIPILMVTALNETEKHIMALEAGANDFLSKPFSISELAARVRNLLRIKQQHDELESRNQLFYNVIRSYVSPEVSEQILKNPQRYLKLGGESRQVTTLFADIRGFTSYAQTHRPDRIVELLNLVFKELIEVVFMWRGTFDKYLGDSIMAIYGAPVSYQDDALRAIRTALDMQAAFKKLREGWTDPEERSLALGIGINTGEVVVGNIGTESLMDYTVVGDAVNIAQRLEELAGPGQILISDAVYAQVKRRAQVIPYGTRVLRGRQKVTTIYVLTDML